MQANMLWENIAMYVMIKIFIMAVTSYGYQEMKQKNII